MWQLFCRVNLRSDREVRAGRKIYGQEVRAGSAEGKGGKGKSKRKAEKEGGKGKRKRRAEKEGGNKM